MKRRIMAQSEMDGPILDVVNKSDHKIVGLWAADCAERVLPYFETKYPHDDRPRKAIAALREWVRTGIFKMKDVRGFSLGAHAAAREVPDFDPARSTARAAGQAMATAHVKTHSVAAAIYAATAIRDASRPEKAEVAVRQEKEWQLNHLLELLATKGKRSPDKA